MNFGYHTLLVESKGFLRNVIYLMLNQIMLVQKSFHNEYRWNSWCNAGINETSKKINAYKATWDSKTIYGT